MLILYPAALLNSYILTAFFLWITLDFLYKLSCHMLINIFISSFPIWMPFCCSCLIVIHLNQYILLLANPEKAMAPHSSTLAWKIPWMEACQAAVHGVAKSQTQLSDFTFTFHFHALEKEMATHSSVLAWRISGTGEPDGLPFMGLHRVRHD